MAANLRHCSRPGCLSAMRTVSRASPSVLETRKCCSSWPNSIVTSDRLSLFFHSLHRVFQCWMSHTCEVSGQVRPRSPARTALLPEPIRHLILRLHQPDTCTRACLMMTPSEGRQSTCVLWIKTPVGGGGWLVRVKDAASLWAIRAAHNNRGAPA